MGVNSLACFLPPVKSCAFNKGWCNKNYMIPFQAYLSWSFWESLCEDRIQLQEPQVCASRLSQHLNLQECDNTLRFQFSLLTAGVRWVAMCNWVKETETVPRIPSTWLITSWSRLAFTAGGLEKHASHISHLRSVGTATRQSTWQTSRTFLFQNGVKVVHRGKEKHLVVSMWLKICWHWHHGHSLWQGWWWEFKKPLWTAAPFALR